MPKSNSPKIDTDGPEENDALASRLPEDSAETSFERAIVWAIIAVTMILTSLPFLFARFLDGPYHRFVGQVYNVDDYCVYSSWINQVADGSIYIRNLFTNRTPARQAESIFIFCCSATLSALLIFRCPGS